MWEVILVLVEQPVTMDMTQNNSMIQVSLVLTWQNNTTTTDFFYLSYELFFYSNRVIGALYSTIWY